MRRCYSCKSQGLDVKEKLFVFGGEYWCKDHALAHGFIRASSSSSSHSSSSSDGGLGTVLTLGAGVLLGGLFFD